MAVQSGERRVTAEVGEELISLIVPDVDPELVQLVLSCAARSAAGGHADHEGLRGLLLVQALSLQWGWYSPASTSPGGHAGKAVWAIVG